MSCLQPPHRLSNEINPRFSLLPTVSLLPPARLLTTHRQNSGSDSSSVLSRKTSTASSYKPPVRAAYGAAAASTSEPAPPAYSTGGATPALAGKRPAPPPPRPKVGLPQAQYVTALYDYAATAEGDLSFAAGDRIELVKKTDSTEDWWTGRLNGVEGVFPGKRRSATLFSTSLTRSHSQETTSTFSKEV